MDINKKTYTLDKILQKIKIISSSFGDYCKPISGLKYYSYIRAFMIDFKLCCSDIMFKH